LSAFDMRALATMYPLPELAAANMAWWDGLARHWRAAGLHDVPPFAPFPPEPYEVWLAPDLFFAQTCGYPLTHRLRDQVTLVATPCYAAPGCSGSDYCSRIIVRADSGIPAIGDLAGKVAAINSHDSQSGWNALRHALAPVLKGDAFPRIVETGAHRHSLAAVREGRADVMAIDCVTFALLGKAAPQEVAGLRVLADTASAPSLPYVTRKDIAAADLQRLRDGLKAAIADPTLAEARRALMIRDVVVLPLQAYDRILDMEAAA
jgi:ABC-type phosphate/phosphonate transport system substrate-binding protein